jgi:putative restriction endonuclease
VPHKPLLLLWMFGQFAATGSSAATYQQAEEPVSELINDFGPPVASAAADLRIRPVRRQERGRQGGG